MNGDNYYELQQVREELRELKGGLSDGLQITLARIKETEEFKSRTLIALERLSINYENIRDLTLDLEKLVQGGENKDSIILRINLLEHNLKMATSQLEEKLAAQRVVNQQASERGWQVRMAIIGAALSILTSVILAVGSNIDFKDSDSSSKQEQTK